MADTSKLDGVHPDLVKKVGTICAAMSALGFPMKPVQGVRTQVQQSALYAAGRTLPGKVVTNCDGVLKKSNHQVHSDGFGHAVDCGFDALDMWSDRHPWAVYGACAEALGLVWGGRFTTLVDRPHVELPSV